MKQKRVKNHLKIGSLFFGIFLVFLACQKESFDDHQELEILTSKRLKRITLNELNLMIGNSNDYSRLSKMFDVNKPKRTGSQQRLENSDNPYLLTDEIVMIENENATFYTFTIESDLDGNEFFNLVVAMDEYNTIRSTRILEYAPSELWLQDRTQPFHGEVIIHDNDIFSVTDINNLLSARSSNQCVTDVTGEWECTGGWESVPNPPGVECQGWEYVITVHWGPCPEIIDAGPSSEGGGGWPVDSGNPSSGGGSSDGGSGDNSSNGNPPNDNEDCIVDSNGNCLTDDTTPLPPRDTIDEEDDICEELQKLFETPNYPIQSPLVSPKQAIVNLKNAISEDIDPNNDQEQGYNLLHNSSLQSYASEVNNSSHKSVRYRFSINNFGGLHLHPNDGKGHPFFSPEDILNLWRFYDTYDTGSPTDPSLFVHVLVSTKGVYALKIDSPLLISFLEPIYNDYGDANEDGIDEVKEFSRPLKNAYNRFKDLASGFPNGSDSQYQRAFLKFMNSFNNNIGMGISLYKANDDLTNWSELTLNDSDEIIPNPCNN